MADFQLYYGDYAFQVRKTWVDFTYQDIMSKLGYRMFTRVTARFGGTLKGADSDAVDALIDACNLAMVPDRDFVLKKDGVATKHSIYTNQTLDGVKIVQFQWVKGNTQGARGNGTEFVNKRSFLGTVTADIPNVEQEIVEWQETIRQEGTGGSDFEIKESISGLPVAQALQGATALHVIQEGYAIGWSTWPVFPSPKYPSSVKPKPSSYMRGPATYGRYVTRLHPIRWRYVHKLSTTPPTAWYPLDPPLP